MFLITHIGGWINPDIEAISLLCKKKGIILIEDCAHSLGSTLNNKHSGLFGDAGVYSLYATKAIPAGEGGIIVTKSTELSVYLEKYSKYDRFDQKLDLGVNNRMSEIGALLSYSVLLEIENIIENKYMTAKRYIKQCNQYGWTYLDPEKNGQRSNLYKFILITAQKTPKKIFKR